MTEDELLAYASTFLAGGPLEMATAGPREVVAALAGTPWPSWPAIDRIAKAMRLAGEERRSEMGPCPHAAVLEPGRSVLAMSPGRCADVVGRVRQSEVRRRPQAEASYREVRCLPDDLVDDLREWMISAAAAVNLWWGFDTSGLECRHYRYHGIGHGLPIHSHLGPGQQNTKFSMAIQLSDPASYLGGDLRLHPTVATYEDLTDGPAWWDAPRARGAVVAFPAWTPHEVTPLEEGERECLLILATGPRLR